MCRSPCKDIHAFRDRAVRGANVSAPASPAGNVGNRWQSLPVVEIDPYPNQPRSSEDSFLNDFIASPQPSEHPRHAFQRQYLAVNAFGKHFSGIWNLVIWF